MSRLGKLPIKLPTGCQASLADGFVIIKGPKGELKEKIHPMVKVEINGEEINVSVVSADIKKQKALWGLFWSLVRNMVKGVSEGYVKKLEANGVGYKVAINGNKIILNVGYSHPVEFLLPEGVNGQVEGNVITLSSISNQLLGETAYQIREVRKPEPYKGKGIKYSDEVIRRKEGKTASK
jgi:large subunit ribosomal protein L6